MWLVGEQKPTFKLFGFTGNYFKKEFQATNQEIAILCSEDSHYSMDKAANLLSIPIYKTEVNKEDRLPKNIATQIENAKANGAKYFITVVNMMTTMFGSVDRISRLCGRFESSPDRLQNSC